MADDFADFAKMDDPTLIDERRRLREALQHDPSNLALTRRYANITTEFIHRTRAAWAKTG